MNLFSYTFNTGALPAEAWVLWHNGFINVAAIFSYTGISFHNAGNNAAEQ